MCSSDLYRTQRISKQGVVMAVSIISTALLNEAGDMYAIATTERSVGGTAGATAGGTAQ